MKQLKFDMQAHAVDEFLLAEKPLKHSKRKAHTDLNKMEPELQRVEEQ
jgi:hypothetical protein